MRWQEWMNQTLRCMLVATSTESMQGSCSSCSSPAFLWSSVFFKIKKLAFLISGQAIANICCMSDTFRDDSKEGVSQVSLRTVLFFLRGPASDVTGRVPWNGGLSWGNKKLRWRKERTYWWKVRNDLKVVLLSLDFPSHSNKDQNFMASRTALFLFFS